MKDKIKNIFLVILYIVGMFLFFSLIEVDLKNTKIGEIVQTLGIIVGLVIFGFIVFCWIAAIYVAIRDYFKRKIQEAVRREIARQKYLEKKQIRNDDNDVQHE